MARINHPADPIPIWPRRLSEIVATKQRVYHILSINPALRPAERVDKLQRYLWVEGEIQALREDLKLHPRQARRARRSLHQPVESSSEFVPAIRR